MNWKGEWETGRWEKSRSRGGTRWGNGEMPEEAKGEEVGEVVVSLVLHGVVFVHGIGWVHELGGFYSILVARKCIVHRAENGRESQTQTTLVLSLPSPQHHSTATQPSGRKLSRNNPVRLKHSHCKPLLHCCSPSPSPAV